MPVLIDKLKELIHPNAIQIPCYDALKKEKIFTLVEKKSPGSQIRIAGIPEGSVIFNLDDFFPIPKPPLPYIFTAEYKSVCCRADYVIVSPDCLDENKNHIVFIEMKNGVDEMSHIRDQLRGARCFMDYCVSLINHFWKCKITEIDEDDCRYVACLKTGSDVGNRYDNNEPPHTNVDDPLKLEGRRLYRYNQLIGRKPR